MDASGMEAQNTMNFRQLDLPIGDCLRRGWDLTKENLGPMIGYTVILLVIFVVLGLIPFIGAVIAWVISPSLGAGYFIYLRKRMRGEPADFNDFFGGFQYFGQLFLVGLVSAVLVSIGLILCIVPGLYLAVGYMFSSFLVIARNLEFWPAMEISRRAVTANLGSIIVFVLAIVGINIVGALACLVGLFATIPWTYCAVVIAFQFIFESEVPPLPTPGPVQI